MPWGRGGSDTWNRPGADLERWFIQGELHLCFSTEQKLPYHFLIILEGHWALLWCFWDPLSKGGNDEFESMFLEGHLFIYYYLFIYYFIIYTI